MNWCRFGIRRAKLVREYWEPEEDWQYFKPYDIEWHYGVYSCRCGSNSYHWRFL